MAAFDNPTADHKLDISIWCRDNLGVKRVDWYIWFIESTKEFRVYLKDKPS